MLGLFSRLLIGAMAKVAQWLRVSDSLTKAEVIMVLAGGNGERQRLAAELYHAGYAPFILLTRATTEVLGHTIHLDRLARRNLRQQGVPDEAIRRLPGLVRSTYDEACRLAFAVVQEAWQKVIIVTDPWHSRRAALTFRQRLRRMPVQMMMAPCEFTQSLRQGWPLEKKLHFLLVECLKLLYYLARGRLNFLHLYSSGLMQSLWPVS